MTLQSLDYRRLLCYGVAPLTLGCALVGLYYSGWPAAQALVAPAHTRELGLLENLQNLLLVLMVVVALRAAGRSAAPRWRTGWRVVALLALFVLGEEVDWGAHWLRALVGETGADPHARFNLHNLGEAHRWIKRVVDAGAVVLFGCLPPFARRFPERLRRWLPPVDSLLLLGGALVVRTLAHHLEDAGAPSNQALSQNVSEFRELFTYGLALSYLIETGLVRPPRVD